MPSIIIFTRVYYLHQYFKNDLNGDIIFIQSSSSYSNNKLGLKYLEHFNQYTQSGGIGKYCILLFNSHRSYLT